MDSCIPDCDNCPRFLINLKKLKFKKFERSFKRLRLLSGISVHDFDFA